MSLDMGDGAMDIPSDVEELFIPDPPGVPAEIELPPDTVEPFDEALDKVEDVTGVDELAALEGKKADAAIEFASDALNSAGQATGKPDLFAAETDELVALKMELAEASEPVVGGVEVVATIAEEPQKNILIHSVEIPVADETELEILERADAIVSYKSEKAKSPEEIRFLREQLENMRAKEFPDDAKFEKAVKALSREADYIAAAMPMEIEGGAVDLDSGKSSTIEIISPDEPLVTRPSREELDQAVKDMSATSRGQVMEMLGYMRAYETVASGVTTSKELNVSADVLKELRRKSWFEKVQSKNETPLPTREEKVGGLMLTWEDTAEYYESIGDSQTAERILATGRFELSQSSMGDTLVGEQHLRLVKIEEQQKKFESLLEQLEPGDRVVVEHTSMKNKNAWTALSEEKRFMELAEEFAQEDEQVELEVLDEADEDIVEGTWEELAEDTGIDPEEMNFVKGMLDASLRLPSGAELGELIAEIQGSEFLTDEAKRARLLGVQRFIQVLSANPTQAAQDIELINQLNVLFTQIDSVRRERRYQEKIQRLKSEYPDSKLFIVVGNSHTAGLAQALENTNYRTKYDSVAIEKFKNGIGKIKS